MAIPDHTLFGLLLYEPACSAAPASDVGRAAQRLIEAIRDFGYKLARLRQTMFHAYVVQGQE